jgi:hypothetical protein
MKTARLLTAGLLMVACMAPGEGADLEIRFKRGATEAHVSGRLSAAQEVCYALTARSGQKMKLNADGKGAITIQVTPPHGDTEGEPGGVLEMDLTETGKYRVCLAESKMGDPWKGTFTLNVRIR